MIRSVLICLAVAFVAGCGGSGKTVPVSGIVTLNGKPLASAHVSFLPQEGKVAPGSDGTTDETGHYELTVTVTGESGAVPGKHTVRITAADANQTAGDDTIKRVPEPVPARYNSQSTLEFTVPAKGTDKADFPLTAP
jgi:hypothetical protein